MEETLDNPTVTFLLKVGKILEIKFFHKEKNIFHPKHSRG